MLAVPYLSLGIVGFMIYRGCKKNAAYREALEKGENAKPRSEPFSPTSDSQA